jgi:hypothetical protein
VIEAEVTYSDADYQRAVRFMSRDQYRLFTLMIVIGGILLGSFLYRAGFADLGWWVIPAILISLAFMYGVSLLTQRANIARQLAKIPDSHGPYVWTFDGDGIRIGGSLSSSVIKWAAIIKVRETKLDFFFYVAPKFARFLPKRNLTDQGVAELKALITDCIPGKARLIG